MTLDKIIMESLRKNEALDVLSINTWLLSCENKK